MTQVSVRVFVRGTIQSFARQLTGDIDLAVRELVDYYEGQVGTVLTVYASDKRLYKGVAEAWELGVR